MPRKEPEKPETSKVSKSEPSKGAPKKEHPAWLGGGHGPEVPPPSKSKKPR